MHFTVQASGPIDISSDEELESAEPRQPGGQSAAAADTRELRRSTHSTAQRSTAARFEVGGQLLMLCPGCSLSAGMLLHS